MKSSGDETPTLGHRVLGFAAALLIFPFLGCPSRAPAPEPAGRPVSVNRAHGGDEAGGALQIGGIARFADRVGVSALVLSGRISAGDRLMAIGLEPQPCIVDEVLVDGLAGTARGGDTCLVFLRDPDPSLLEGGTARYYGLVRPEDAFHSSTVRVSLAWASHRDERLPAGGPGFSPAVPRPLTDARVRLRFADVLIHGTLKAPAASLPPSSVEEAALELDRSLSLVAGLRFSMDHEGEFAAVGTILGPIEAAGQRDR